MYGFSASLRGGQRAVDHSNDAMQPVVVHTSKIVDLFIHDHRI